MKKVIAMMILLQVVALGLFAVSHISGIPVGALEDQMQTSDLNSCVRSLSEQGYRILHYNENFVLAATPETPFSAISGAVRLADYPASQYLYLVGMLPNETMLDLSKAGTTLLDLGSAVLLQSKLDDIELRGAIRNPFTLLSMEPMLIPQATSFNSASEQTRTDINQMISLVSVSSVQTLLQSLQDFQTRYARADNRQQVAEWIRQQFLSYGINDAQLQTFTWQNTTQYNVVATIPGTVYPNQYIVVGGHHDSTSNNSDPYLLAPGADDNGSGTVATLEMARVMMLSGYQPKTSIRFITFAAEEFGLWGSKDYAAYAQTNNLNIRLMMNHDMIANQTSTGDWQVRLMPYDGSMDHSAYAAQITEQYTSLNPYYGTPNSASSDSHPFWQRGYHVIYFFESDFCPYYHSTNDIVANANPAYCAEVIKASVACAAVFADMPGAPGDLEIHDVGSGTSLQATWQGYDDPTIDHYNLYYSTTAGVWGDPLVTNTTSYTVNNLTEGQLYYFAVSSVDTFANESYLVYSSGIPLSIPLEPQNFTDQPQFQSIALNWDANAELDLAGYLLYRSQALGVQGDLIGGGTITTNTYTDTDVVGSQAFYYYSLCAVDGSGNPSPFAQVLKSRPVTLNQGIVIIDETENMSGVNPFQPNDVQVDDFYNSVTRDFDVNMLDLNSLEGDLRLSDIGIYSSILWHGNDFASMDYPFGVREVLQGYLQLGGNILYSIYVPSMAFELNSGYPMTFAETSYINSIIGIESAAYDSSARFRYAFTVYGNFPNLQVDPLKTQTSLNGHIFRVEGIEPNDDCIEVYQYGSDYDDSTPQGAMNDRCVGVLNLNNSGKLLTLSYPLYNMYENQARQLIDHLFSSYFNETISAVDDPETIPAPAITISENHPNPFKAKTSFRVELKDNTLPLQVDIYNLRGQLVRSVFAGNSPKSLLIEWDGKDENSSDVSSGVYFIRASQDGATVQKRIVRIK